MFKNLLKKISINLSFYYFKKNELNKKKHFKISNFLKKKINIFFKKNPRLFTHAKLSNEIHKIISEKELDNFLKNPLFQNIFFIHNRFFIRKELAELKKDKYWNLWNKLIIENDIGSPIRYFLYPRSSGNRIRQVYLIQKFLENTKEINLNKIQTIIELGGGYGCMAQLFYKLN